MTRDNKLWLVLMAGAILTTLSAHFDLLQQCCDVTDKTKAGIQLLSLLVTGVSGVMYKSPLKISDEGRMKAIARDRRR